MNPGFEKRRKGREKGKEKNCFQDILITCRQSKDHLGNIRIALQPLVKPLHLKKLASKDLEMSFFQAFSFSSRQNVKISICLKHLHQWKK